MVITFLLTLRLGVVGPRSRRNLAVGRRGGGCRSCRAVSIGYQGLTTPINITLDGRPVLALEQTKKKDYYIFFVDQSVAIVITQVKLNVTCFLMKIIHNQVCRQIIQISSY